MIHRGVIVLRALDIRPCHGKALERRPLTRQAMPLLRKEHNMLVETLTGSLAEFHNGHTII